VTDRLAVLLRDEAGAVDVPPAPALEILADGKHRRRTTRVAAALVGAAAVVLVGATVVAAHDRGSGRAVDPAKIADFEQWGAVAVGRDVYVGDAHVVAPGDISAMYYTSQGVVIRSDGDYELVRADGDVSTVDVHIPDRIPGFEPDSTRFAYAEPAGSGWEVVVHDAATDEELARVTVDGSFTWGGWEAPPVAIDGDHVWTHFDGHWTDVNWRTGAARDVPATDRTYELANGSYAVQRNTVWEVRSWSDQSLVGSAALPRGWYAFFSPDGRYLRAFPNESAPAQWQPRVYDVATGAERTVADPGEDFGWTPSGDLLVVDGGELRVCPPMGGECSTRSFDRGSGDLRIGGNPYES